MPSVTLKYLPSDNEIDSNCFVLGLQSLRPVHIQVEFKIFGHGDIIFCIMNRNRLLGIPVIYMEVEVGQYLISVFDDGSRFYVRNREFNLHVFIIEAFFKDEFAFHFRTYRFALLYIVGESIYLTYYLFHGTPFLVLIIRYDNIGKGCSFWFEYFDFSFINVVDPEVIVDNIIENIRLLA